MNDKQWEDFINEPRTGFSITEMRQLVDEVNRLRKGLKAVREIYTYKDGLDLPVEHIARQMDRRANECLEEGY